MKKLPPVMSYVSVPGKDNSAPLEGAIRVDRLLAVEPVGSSSCSLILEEVTHKHLVAYEPAEAVIKRWIDTLIALGESS